MCELTAIYTSARQLVTYALCDVKCACYVNPTRCVFSQPRYITVASLSPLCLRTVNTHSLYFASRQEWSLLPAPQWLQWQQKEAEYWPSRIHMTNPCVIQLAAGVGLVTINVTRATGVVQRHPQRRKTSEAKNTDFTASRQRYVRLRTDESMFWSKHAKYRERNAGQDHNSYKR